MTVQLIIQFFHPLFLLSPSPTSAIKFPEEPTFSNWTKLLVPDYLTTNDLCKLLSAAGKVVPLGTVPTIQDTAVRVYDVSKNSDSHTVFLTTANFTNTPAGGLPLESSAKPYGNKGFVVFRQGGDGAILLPKQTGDTNIIGTYAPLLR